MFEVRLHGRGGQGTVTAAELLSVAAFDDGHYAQAFPSFGSERTGAPVEAYCRMAAVPIRTREPVFAPNAVLVMDATLVHHVDLFSGLADDGYLLLNSIGTFDDLGLGDLAQRLPHDHLATVAATDLALEHLGRPTPNAALLGGFAALTGQVSLAAVAEAFRSHFPGPVGEGNATVAAAAYEYVSEEVKERTHAPD